MQDGAIKLCTAPVSASSRTTNGCTYRRALGKRDPPCPCAACYPCRPSPPPELGATGWKAHPSAREAARSSVQVWRPGRAGCRIYGHSPALPPVARWPARLGGYPAPPAVRQTDGAAPPADLPDPSSAAPDLVAQRAEGKADAGFRVEAAEPAHRTVALLDAQVILLQPVVQVLVAAVLDLPPRGLPDGRGAGGVPVGGHLLPAVPHPSPASGRRSAWRCPGPGAR